MGKRTGALLAQLEELRERFDPASGKSKLALLSGLESGNLGSDDEIYRLHETLCFLRAYPDDRPLLRRVEGMLRSFDQRKDLKRFKTRLADSGISGTPIYFAFYWFTALWLLSKWPDRLTIDWKYFDNRQKLLDFLHLLLPYTETPTIDDLSTHTVRDMIEMLKAPGETDAAFLINRFKAFPADSFARETVYEDLDPPLLLEPGPDTPSRTRAKYRKSPVFFQTGPLRTGRPSFPGDIRIAPSATADVTVREGKRLIDLAREAMITRDRDLDIFVHADPKDVRLVDCGDGLQFACFGAIPERRLMLDTVYGFLTLKSGVPIGYVLCNALFQSAGVAYNVFETFRGGESGFIYGRALATIHRLFEADAFYIDPYQLGHENQEGLQSGAWWFYYKLGFRPRDSYVRELLRKELAAMKRNPRHRTGISTLNELASENMYYYLGKPRSDVMGRVSLGKIGMAVTRYLVRRFGSDRERGIRICSNEAAELLGFSSLASRSPGERLAWNRWSPLVMSLPGLAGWSPEELRTLGEVVLAKGGPRETEFLHRFNRHPKLGAALAGLAGRSSGRAQDQLG